ncbi:MAG: hypothetical protein ACREDQ_11065 [Limisphaerales bacterium]
MKYLLDRVSFGGFVFNCKEPGKEAAEAGLKSGGRGEHNFKNHARRLYNFMFYSAKPT